MVKYLNIILFLSCVSLVSFGQQEISLKKKYFGKYRGTISAYQYESDNRLINVAESEILIDLFKEEITIKIGKNENRGSYEVMFEADDYFLVDAKMEGVLATERILVYKKGKKLGRDGMYPQPVCELERYARK